MFERFLKEKRLLENVSNNTVTWYEQSLCSLGTESPTEDDLKQFVMKLREKGLKIGGINFKIRAVNSFLKWATA